VKRTAGYSLMDCRRNDEIVTAVQAPQIMKFIGQYRGNWIEHVHMMSCNRIPKVP
jgi:hypothetical protein